MSGIDVSSGARSSVDTDEIHERAMYLDMLAATVSAWRFDVREAAAAVAAVPQAAAYDFARSDLLAAGAALERASDQAARVGAAAAVAATAYGTADRVANSLFDWMGGLAGRAVGFLATRALPALIAPLAGSALPVVIPALVAAGVVWAHPVSRRAVATLGADLGSWIGANSRYVATPAAVGLVRAVVSASDDVIAGALRLPRRAADAGLVGVVSSPLVAGTTRLVDTPVSVAPVGGARTITAPSTVADIAARIPANAPGQPQIRIEKYEGPEGDRAWAVYVGSTVEFGVGESEEPFDLESAIGTMAGEDGAAYRAVEQAMADAGVGADEPVTLAGHSQGGLVAAALAQSGDYAVESLVTFGAPSAQIPAADGVSTVVVEHSDDLVPALAGQAPADDARTVVSRDTLSREQEGDSLLSAHSIEEYTRTADLMDRSDDQRVVEFRESLMRSVAGGASGAATEYRADRELR
jgi:hypothetical protein